MCSYQFISGVDVCQNTACHPHNATGQIMSAINLHSQNQLLWKLTLFEAFWFLGFIGIFHIVIKCKPEKGLVEIRNNQKLLKLIAVET